MPRAVWDPWGRRWTVGYGQTQGVGPNSTMTRAQAEADLRGRMNSSYEPYVRRFRGLNQNQYDALCSLIWNTGPGVLSGPIGTYLRSRNYQAAADYFCHYTTAGGTRLQGLVNRRAAERRLFLKPPPDPHHYQRYDQTRRNTPWGPK